MPRAFLAASLAGGVALLVALLVYEERRAFTLGVAPSVPAVELRPEREICQGPMGVPEGGEFAAVRVSLGTYFRPTGPPLAVSVRRAGGGAVLARGRLDGGYPDIAAQPVHEISTGRVGARQRIDVCLRNVGTRRVAVFGSAGAASPGSVARTQRGRVSGNDLSLEFMRAEPRTGLGLLPHLFERASLWELGWSGAWLYWVLLAGVLVGVPTLLALALTRAAGAER